MPQDLSEWPRFVCRATAPAVAEAGGGVPQDFGVALLCVPRRCAGCGGSRAAALAVAGSGGGRS